MNGLIEKLIDAIEISAKNAQWDDFDTAIHSLRATLQTKPVGEIFNGTKLLDSLKDVLAWDKRRTYILPYKIRDNALDAIAIAEAEEVKP